MQLTSHNIGKIFWGAPPPRPPDFFWTLSGFKSFWKNDHLENLEESFRPLDNAYMGLSGEKVRIWGWKGVKFMGLEEANFLFFNFSASKCVKNIRKSTGKTSKRCKIFQGAWRRYKTIENIIYLVLYIKIAYMGFQKSKNNPAPPPSAPLNQ